MRRTIFVYALALALAVDALGAANVEAVLMPSRYTADISVADARAQGRLKPGDLVLMAAFGGGLTWAASLVRW